MAYVPIEVTPENIQKAIGKIAGHQLGKRLDQMGEAQAHEILPQIWPIIQELRLLTDACEIGKLKPA